MAYEYDYMLNFTGGENSNSAPDNLMQNQLLIGENIDLSERGGFKRRYGITAHKTLGEVPIDRLIEFEYLKDASRVLKRYALIAGALVDIDTGTTLSSGWGDRIAYEVFGNKLYLMGNDKYMVHDGTTIADVTCTEADSNLTAVKRCKYIMQRGQRLFAAGDAQNPNLLYFSEPGRPEYWKTASLIKAVTDDADIITGLIEYHGALLAFKTRTVYAWFGYDPTVDVEFKQLLVHTGTRSYRTIVRVGNSIIYLGEDGVYELLGTYENVIVSRKLSNDITPRVRLIKHATDPYLDTSCAVFYEGKYMLSVPTVADTANDMVLTYFVDLATQENDPWVIYKGWNISDFLKSLDGKLYSGSATTGIVHLHDTVYNDLGVGIEVTVKLRPASQNYLVHNKKYKNGYVIMRQHADINSNVAITCAVDYREITAQVITADESLSWDLRNWDDAKWDFTDLVTRKFIIREKGKRVIILLSDNTVDQTLNIYGFALEYKVKKPDRG